MYIDAKEYLLVIEGPVPPFVVHRKHSPNLSLPALSAVIQTDRYYKMLQTERREVGWVLPTDNEGGGLTLLLLINILWSSPSSVQCTISGGWGREWGCWWRMFLLCKFCPLLPGGNPIHTTIIASLTQGT